MKNKTNTITLAGRIYELCEEKCLVYCPHDIARLIYRSRIKYSDLCAYVGSKDFYAWHISDLVIYDKPRELSQFEKPRDYIYQSYKRRNSFFKGITRPPQSWCYVEE